MTIIHHLSNGKERTAHAQNPHFLLTNTLGDSLILGTPNNSNYNGLMLQLLGVQYKTLANLVPLAETAPQELFLTDRTATRTFTNAEQQFLLAEKGLLVRARGDFLLTLDCKRRYDESDAGRIYSIGHQPAFDEEAAHTTLAKVTVFPVTYTKYKDARIVPDNIEYLVHLCIVTSMRATPLGSWRQVSYSYDRTRGTPSTPWVYDALQLSDAGDIAIAIGATAREAQRRALDVFLLRKRMHEMPHATHSSLPLDARIALRALNALQTPRGTFAGLPWFSQVWSRDELITLGGLLAARRYIEVAAALERWYALLRPDGTLPAIAPDEGLTSADAPGWLARRTLDLVNALDSQGKMNAVRMPALIEWRDKLALLIKNTQLRLRDDLVWSASKTTWMDTDGGDRGRSGARIEIQALTICIVDAYERLCILTRVTPLPEYLALREKLQHAVQTRFVQDGMLIDGFHDDSSVDRTLRPNIFLAWYVSPELFSQEQWRAFFERALPLLWLPWGGVSSIERSSPLFHPRYTGEDIASYHRGDSWYFVNNIVAMALYATSKERERSKIALILEASLRDLTAHGIVGHASELSSADVQEPCGCHAQAWSASTLLELIVRLSS